MRSRSVLVFVLAVFSVCLLTSCARSPSKTVIKSAIVDLLNRDVPDAWSGSLMSEKNVNVEIIEIKAVGKFNKQRNYWPVKARVKGTCEVSLSFSYEFRRFHGIGDFKLYQDDYGNWKASIIEAKKL